MELKILKEQANPLLQRIEYQFEILHTAAATPSLEEVRGELSKQLKVSKDRLVVERMNARFGTPRTQGEALAYKNADAVKRISREHILLRNKLKEKAAAAPPGATTEGPAAPASPEAPAAEKPAAAEKAPAKETPAKETAPKESAPKEHASKEPAAKEHAGKEHAPKEKGAAEKPSGEKGGAHKGKAAKAEGDKKE
jgi:ribosomal protein S24E